MCIVDPAIIHKELDINPHLADLPKDELAECLRVTVEELQAIINTRNV
jgi:hypothetical protein